MLVTGISAILCVVLLIGTVTGWYWIDVYSLQIEQVIGYHARRIIQSLILPSGLAISAAAGVVVVNRVGTTGTGFRWSQGEIEYELPETALLGAAEVLAIGGLIGLGIGLLVCGIGTVSRNIHS